MSNRKRKIILTNIEIADIAAEGKAIAKVFFEDPEKKSGLIVFVKGAVPGDVVDLDIFRKKKNYAEGKVLRFHRVSDMRDEPFCSHFGTCGGCVWQNLRYEKQLFYKQKQVADAFTHIARLDLKEAESSETIILPIIPAKEKTFYRNKLEFAFSNKRWLSIEEIRDLPLAEGRSGLGFHISGLFDKVLDIHHCYLQPGLSNEIRSEIKIFTEKKGLSYFDFREQKGFLRNIIIRNSSLNEWMVIVVFGPPYPNTEEADPVRNKELKEELLDHIAKKFPGLTSLMYLDNPKKNDSIFDLELSLYKGRNFIIEQLEDLKFKISPKSFFQTNTMQALELFKVTRDFAGIGKEDIVYDLYTGTGTIANFVAHAAKKVVGIEYIPDAIEDAKENSLINNISNTEFFAGDIRDILTDQFLAEHGKPTVIITDPPRAGMDEKVVKKILEIEAEKVVYVSCNPATQARDVALLSGKYRLKKIQPVDMFPQTHHVENVALLEMKK